MPSNRIGRINEEIQRELSDLLRTVKDPRVQKTMVSVTRVDTTSDLRYAKVFISVYDKEQSKEVFKGLKAAGGFLRRELANRLNLRYTPELVWTEDHSITYGARILDILATLDIPRDDETTGSRQQATGDCAAGGGALDAPRFDEATEDNTVGAAGGRQPEADASDEDEAR